MYGYLIPILAFVSVTAIGGAILTARTARRATLKERLRHAADWAGESPLHDHRQGLIRAVGRVGERVSSRGPSPGLKVELARAGYYGSKAATIYLGAKVLLLACAIGVLGPLVSPTGLSVYVRILLIVGGASIFFFIPNVVVGLKRKARRDETRRHLPDVLDLLEICVSSGMGLDMAWNSLADEMRHVSPVLADEMALTNLEMHLGAPRAMALRHMAERTGAEEVSSLVAVLVQGEKFGVSIADSLRTFARSMRQLRSQRAEEAAEKMAVKLLFPMVIFVVPPMFVVAVGPAVLKIIEIFKH